MSDEADMQELQVKLLNAWQDAWDALERHADAVEELGRKVRKGMEWPT